MLLQEHVACAHDVNTLYYYYFFVFLNEPLVIRPCCETEQTFSVWSVKHFLRKYYKEKHATTQVIVAYLWWGNYSDLCNVCFKLKTFHGDLDRIAP